MLQNDKKCHWWVSDTLGQKRGWLWHYSSHSKTLPTRGWQYADGGIFQDDLTLTMTPWASDSTQTVHGDSNGSRS